MKRMAAAWLLGAAIGAPSHAAAQRLLMGKDDADTASARAAPGSAPVTFDIAGDTHADRQGVQSEHSFYVSLDEPPGNYRVTLLLGGALASDTTVKAELRRLELSGLSVPAGGTKRASFLVNVRTPDIVGGGTVRLKAPRETTQEAVAWDRRLTLEFNGLRPSVREIRIEPVTVPTLYLLGDSTVCDQSGEPYASWGQMLTAMVGPGAVVSNQGESGESVSASNDRGRFAKILGDIRAGDLFIVQFGHNDMKEKLRDPEASLKYRDGLIAWVQAVHAKGARAIIVTPMERHNFVNGRIASSLDDYPQMAREAARLSSAGLIDLTALSTTLYESFGEAPSWALFKHDADGTNRDMTHHSPFGAWELARLVAAGIARSDSPLSAAIKPEFRHFDPAKPDRLVDFRVPASPVRLTIRPLGDDANPAKPR
ncbi:hypothetical protein HL653_20810 [Sphingomonas sp. AP4-R1]|uniref:GDSL-type esterase/lipase family protein n=1 Tax=Sphingomonas sp. AP4-R1 TaxID=2735134 RepID=UPI00149349F6|nr:GDSL-type esterase/lipase family protein [Sphingomonas sp. AP4-R1]QJU59859.1 hypothetical protein HL653_20810 [Sphingomonas sp. AP4-R1]